MEYIRTPQKVNVAPAVAARKANALVRRAVAAQELLEHLGCTIQWPAEPHPSIAAATIRR